MDLDTCNSIAEKIKSESKPSEIGPLSFSGTYDLSFIFTKDGIDELLKNYGYLKPFIDEVIDTDKYNVFFLNSLIISDGKGISRHIDVTISKYTDTMQKAEKVSIIYLKVPDDMVGGQLYIYDHDDDTKVKKVKPKQGKLVSFYGNPHSVGTTFTDYERISLVLESYNCTEYSYSQIPRFKME
jgi:hypothetical protein